MHPQNIIDMSIGESHLIRNYFDEICFTKDLNEYLEGDRSC